MRPRNTPFLPRRLRAIAGGLALSGLSAGPTAAQTPAPAPEPAPRVLGTPAAAAAPTGPWTLQAAVDYALAHNLNVRQNDLNARNNQQILRQSKAALLPTVNLSASQSWQYGTSVNPLTFEYQNQASRANNFNGTAQVTLFQGFQLRNTIKRNVLDYEASVQDIAKARNDLSLNVASQFLQLVLAQELVRANQLRVDSDQAQIARTRILLKAGSIPESTLLDGQSQLATDELNVITAQNQVDIARLSLMQLLNIDPATAQDFRIDVPQFADPDEDAPLALDLNQVYQRASTTLPEIKAAELRVESARRNIDFARGGYYPRLLLSGQAFSGYSSVRTVTSVGTDSTARRSTFFVNNGGTTTPLSVLTYQRNIINLPQGFWDQLNKNFGQQINLSLSIPVLNGLQVRTGVQRAIINEELATVRAEQARLTLRQSIEQAYVDARAAQLQYAASKRQVAALTLTQRNSEIRFNNGLLNGTEFNISKNNLNFAESNRIQAKYSYIFRRKVLDFYQGKSLSL